MSFIAGTWGVEQALSNNNDDAIKIFFILPNFKLRKSKLKCINIIDLAFYQFARKITSWLLTVPGFILYHAT